MLASPVDPVQLDTDKELALIEAGLQKLGRARAFHGKELAGVIRARLVAIDAELLAVA